MRVPGTSHPAFAPLADLFEANLTDGTEAGASLAVIHDGELVVDLWGGEARPGVPWERDTIVHIWSITKTMSALTVLVLADRGVLDLDAPVATYWPEFSRGDVLVRHVLAHTSGYAGWTESLDAAGLMDLPYAEGCSPRRSRGGSRARRRATTCSATATCSTASSAAPPARPLADQFRELVAEPARRRLPPRRTRRRARALRRPGRRRRRAGSTSPLLPEGNLLVPTLANPFLDVGGFCNTAPWRRSRSRRPTATATPGRSPALQSVVSHGGEVDGVRLLSPATIDRIFEVQADGPDLVLMVPLRWGIGYGLPQPATAPAVPDGRVCWWTGYGGVDRRQRPGPPHDRRLRDEPDGSTTSRPPPAPTATCARRSPASRSPVTSTSE